MAIVTLTTDFGWKDYYLAIFKGALLSKNPQINIIDITHDIPCFDVVRAAFVVKNVYNDFPIGSIHIVCVDNASTRKDGILIIQHEGQFFIGPDNGLFSIIFDPLPQVRVRMDYSPSSPLDFRVKCTGIVEAILTGENIINLGEKAEKIEERLILQPVASSNQLRGTIVHIDNYHNVIINITKELFERYRQGRNFALFFKRFDPITQLVNHYFDVPVGEIACLFNSSNLLEISINSGKAAELFGLQLGDVIHIDFT